MIFVDQYIRTSSYQKTEEIECERIRKCVSMMKWKQ